MDFLFIILLLGYSSQSFADASRIECRDTGYVYHGLGTNLNRVADSPDGEMGYQLEGGIGPRYHRGTGFGIDTFCSEPDSSHACPAWIKFRSGFARGVVGDEQTDVEMGRYQDTRSISLHCKIVAGDTSHPPISQITDVLPEDGACASRKRFPSPRDYAVFAKLRGAVGTRDSELSDTSLLADVYGDVIEPSNDSLKQEIAKMALLGFKPIYARDKQYRDFVYLDFYYNNSGFIPQTGSNGIGSSSSEYDSLSRQLPYYFSNSDGALTFKTPNGTVNNRCMN